MTELLAAAPASGVPRITPRKARVGLVAGGLGAYWTDEWSGSGIAHHWALGTGHRVQELRAAADLLGLGLIAA